MNKLAPLLLAFWILLSACLPNLPANEPNSQSGPVSNIPASDKLDLSNRGLTSISQDVFKMTEIREMDISDNNLTGALPAEIRHLKNLEVLVVANNQMTGVPAEIGQLENLRILDLSDNQLTGLPYELANLKNLEVLNLSGNNYSEQDLAVIIQGLPSSTQIIK